MRTVTVAVVVLLVAAVPAGAVSGGETAAIQTVPFVAGTGSCTGTLIAPDRVLTAGHCVDGVDPERFGVVVGADAHNPAHVPRTAVHRAREFAIHPGYTLAFPFARDSPQNATAVDDVAIIVLTKPVEGIAPITIAGPADAALEAPGTSVRVLGYGEIGNLVRPPALQSGTLAVLSATRCREAYPGAIHATDLCALDVADDDKITQPCPGDSGGPLIAQGPAGPVQVGVTSWASEVKNKTCGDARLPGVWMRVSSYHAFLTDPEPVFVPHTRAKVKLRGRHRLTCVAPAFKGSPARLSYAWGVPRMRGQLTQAMPRPLKRIKGATTRHFTRGRGGRLACAVTARNASGSWTVYSHTVPG
jgi:secreted trypsin-like serine protease